MSNWELFVKSMLDVPAMLQGIAALFIAWAAIYKLIPKINKKDDFSKFVFTLIKKYYSSAEGIGYDMRKDQKTIAKRVIQVNKLENTKEMRVLIEGLVKELAERGYY